MGGLSVTDLSRLRPEERTKAPPLLWAEAACDALMAHYPDPERLPPERRWHYHQGVFLHGMMRLWEKTGESRYLDYAKTYVDRLVDPLGNLLFARDELDAIMAGLLLFPLHARFGDPRYAAAARKLRGLFDTLNRTSEGGFWHKDKYPYQMWLDGLYMGGVFAAVYARVFGEPALVETVLLQESLMRKHMLDRRTGLLYHAWDESRRAPWADRETGCSPEFWGRSIGWYATAVADIADELPADAPARAELGGVLAELLRALARYQDAATGLWYQVVDKSDRPDNWPETSCSALFVYAYARAIRRGWLEPAYAEVARKGWAGLLGRLRFDAGGRLVVPDICVGTSAGDYAHYVARPRSDNDLHGVGAFVLACVEVAQTPELRIFFMEGD